MSGETREASAGLRADAGAGKLAGRLRLRAHVGNTRTTTSVAMRRWYTVKQVGKDRECWRLFERSVMGSAADRRCGR